MLNRAHRLRHRDEFTEVVRAGRRAGRGTLVVHLRHTDDQSPPRAGFVVSRAVGGAVVRNRVKRRLRHLVRQHLPELPRGTTMVVRALPPAASAQITRLEADLAGALRSAGRSAAGTVTRRSNRSRRSNRASDQASPQNATTASKSPQTPRYRP